MFFLLLLFCFVFFFFKKRTEGRDATFKQCFNCYYMHYINSLALKIFVTSRLL